MTNALLIVIAIQFAIIGALVLHVRKRHRIEQALRASESRFRSVADRVPVILWTARPDTSLDFINRYSVEFSGIALEQLIDEGWLRLMHPDDVERSISRYLPGFEARRSFMFEYRVRRAEGAFRWMLASGMPKFDNAGNFTAYCGGSSARTASHYRAAPKAISPSPPSPPCASTASPRERCATLAPTTARRAPTFASCAPARSTR